MASTTNTNHNPSSTAAEVPTTWRPTVKSRLYDLARALGEPFLKAAYVPRFNEWCRTRAAGAPDFPTRYGLYQHLIDAHGLGGPIDFLEFGVFFGESLRWWAEHNGDPAARFVGFDKFTGLPESWVGLPPGTFSAGGQVPQFDDPRVSFEIGYFQETMVDFIGRFPLTRRTVIHLDADLYSATLYVLTMLANHLKPGDVILFDEIGSGYGVTHEFRALNDVETAYGLTYKVLGGADNFRQGAIEII